MQIAQDYSLLILDCLEDQSHDSWIRSLWSAYNRKTVVHWQSWFWSINM